MTYLSLDLGTDTGWATGVDGVLTDFGTWKLATDKEISVAGKTRMSRRLDPRIPRLWHHLHNKHLRSPIDWVVFEDVEFASTRVQAHLWASFRTVVWLFAAVNQIQVECLGVSKLKLFGAGHGGATKEMMGRALAQQRPEEFSIDKAGRVHYFAHDKNVFLSDDAVDAVHILLWAFKTLKTHESS